MFKSRFLLPEVSDVFARCLESESLFPLFPFSNLYVIALSFLMRRPAQGNVPFGIVFAASVFKCIPLQESILVDTVSFAARVPQNLEGGVRLFTVSDS